MNADALWSYNEVVLGGEYDIAEVNQVRTVMDLGANQGAFAIWALSRWPGCHVTCFEPVPETFATLKKNLGHRGDVALIEAAVTDITPAKMRRWIDNCSTASLHDLGETRGEEFEVPTWSPSSLPPADFLKIDTEGCEVEIIRGYLATHKPKAIALEWHREKDRDELVAFLNSQGYTVNATPTAIHENTFEQYLGILKAVMNPEPDPTSKINLHLCVPYYGGQVYTAFEQCRAEAEREGLLHSISYNSDSLVSRSRNVLTQRFLDSTSTHLLFIDCDIVFQTGHLRAIMRALAAGHQVVGGVYPLKQRELKWCLNAMEGEQARPDGLLRVKYLGTGFLAIERSVFYRLAAAHPELIYASDENESPTKEAGGRQRTLHDFWSVGVFRQSGETVGRYLSEDWYFCQRCNDLGIPVWAHTGVKLKHLGLTAYPIDSETQNTALPSPQ